jgi:hypothetical protein
MISALITMAAITYLVIILMLGIQIHTNRNDRNYYRDVIQDMQMQLESRSVGEYAAATKTLKDAPVTSKERIQIVKADLQYDEDHEDAIRVD